MKTRILLTFIVVLLSIEAIFAQSVDISVSTWTKIYPAPAGYDALLVTGDQKRIDCTFSGPAGWYSVMLYSARKKTPQFW